MTRGECGVSEQPVSEPTVEDVQVGINIANTSSATRSKPPPPQKKNINHKAYHPFYDADARSSNRTQQSDMTQHTLQQKQPGYRIKPQKPVRADGLRVQVSTPNTKQEGHPARPPCTMESSFENNFFQTRLFFFWKGGGVYHSPQFLVLRRKG